MSQHTDATDWTGLIEPTATETAKGLLTLALTRPGCEERSSLGPKEEAVRRYILTQCPRLGRAPYSQEIADALRLDGPSEVQRILERLHSLDLLYLDPEGREICSAYPFSSMPTKHTVRFPNWAEAKPVYAQCAVDALGLSFMFRCDLSIASSCAHCDNPITLEAQNQAIVDHMPAETVVWVRTTRLDHAATSLCPTLNFFCSAAHVAAWRQNRPDEVGSVLSLGEALYLAKGIFEDLLISPTGETLSATASANLPHPGKTITAVTSTGGLVAALLASVCCIGPLVFAALGVGVGATAFLAGTAGFLKALLPYRPFFVGLTGLLLGIGFYAAYRKAPAICAAGTSCSAVEASGANRKLLWIMTGFAIVLVLAPYWLGL